MFSGCLILIEDCFFGIGKMLQRTSVIGEWVWNHKETGFWNRRIERLEWKTLYCLLHTWKSLWYHWKGKSELILHSHVHSPIPFSTNTPSTSCSPNSIIWKKSWKWLPRDNTFSDAKQTPKWGTFPPSSKIVHCCRLMSNKEVKKVCCIFCVSWDRSLSSRSWPLVVLLELLVLLLSILWIWWRLVFKYVFVRELNG